ncbi:unnamed protein product, partial [Musa banksii]
FSRGACLVIPVLGVSAQKGAAFGFGVMMHAPSNKRTAAENGDGGIDVVLMRS